MPLSALSVGFDSVIELTIHDAFLPASGLLQCDPLARVSLVTVKTAYDASTGTGRGGIDNTTPNITALSGSAGAGAGAAAAGLSGSPSIGSGNGVGGVRVSISSREVGCTAAKLFTSHPHFDETITFTVPRDAASGLTSLASAAPASVASASSTNGSDRRETVEDYIVISMEDDSALRFYGQAYCPFSPHCPSMAPASAPVRVMLQPRNPQDPNDPLYQKDIRTLAAQRLDDFGFVTVSWKVVVVPHGGALVSAANATSAVDNATPPTFPMGLTLKAAWLAPQSSYHRGTRYTTSVEFGGADRFLFQDGKPIFLTIRSAAQLATAVFHCTVQNLLKPELSSEVAIALPIPSLTTRAALDRDVHWCAAVRTPQGADLGLLLATVRISSRPLEGNTPLCPEENCARINDPVHQEEFAHVAKDYGAGRAMPTGCYGAYQPIYWESESHVSDAAERSWRATCVEEAQPTAEHVRHLFEALMGRAQLDAGVARVAAAFFHRSSAAELTAADLKAFLVACVFHAKGVSCPDAARFCFVALRRDVPDAVAAEEVHFMIQHALIGKTVELPAGELRRIVNDLLGDVQTVTFADYQKYVLRNYTLWAMFGVPLTVDLMCSSAQRQHVLLSAPSARLVETASLPVPTSANTGGVVVPGGSGTAAFPLGSSTSFLSSGTIANNNNNNNNNIPATAAAARGYGMSSGGENQAGQPRRVAGAAVSHDSKLWRTFVVRVQTSGKRFSVTAHVDDSVGDVMRMVESSAGIKASKQEWRLNNETVLDSRTTIGNTTLGLSPALKGTHGGATGSGAHGASGTANPGEVWIREQEESVMLTFSYKDKGQRWQERVICADKILKVRAAVQKKTLIPLSRCVLRVTGADRVSGLLQDRHSVQYYKLKPSDVIEVSHE